MTPLFVSSSTIFLLLSLLLSGSVDGSEINITNPNEFFAFMKNVNDGNTYLGTTVFLESDLLLSSAFGSLNELSDRYFLGVFDGQGHVISNLNVNTSSQYTGLFGFSGKTTIRNVVLDPSCSFTNIHNGAKTMYAGGIIGYCLSSNGPCNIENNVNMASVSFRGNIENYTLYLGGIAGALYSTKHNIHVNNCANYGQVLQSGVSAYSYIGGIVGYTGYSIYKYIRNSLNYGQITHTGATSSSLYMGGIVGYSYYTYIENCMSTGAISSSRLRYKGSLVGFINSPVHVNDCYYTSDTKIDKLYGYGVHSNSSSTLNDLSNTYTAVTQLNYRASKEGWNKWLLNPNSSHVSFKLFNNVGLSLRAKVILLPDPVEPRSFTFAGWYTDSAYKTPLTTQSVSYDTTLYAKWAITIIFISNGGSEVLTPKEVPFNGPYGELPVPTKRGYTFVGWFTENGDVITSNTIVEIDRNHALKGRWNAAKYVVTFDVNGGDALQTPTKVVTFDSPYGELQKPLRKGYAFIGWADSLVDGNSVNNSTIVSTAGDHTLYAIWGTGNYIITFVFEDGSLIQTEQSCGDRIIYPSKVPSKRFHTFRNWCAIDLDNTEVCGIKYVPENDLVFTASFDLDSILLIGIAAGTLGALLIIVILIIIIIVLARKLNRQKYGFPGIEMSAKATKKQI